MISEQMKAEGWIEHDGGQCPFRWNEPIPQVMLRSGQRGWVANIFAGWWWSSSIPRENHVTAYKPEGTSYDQ